MEGTVTIKKGNFVKMFKLVMAVLLVLGAPQSAFAGDKKYPVPPRNPFLADSGLTVFHAEPGQTNISTVPGPVSATRQIGPEDLIWKKIGPNDGYSIQYTGVYPNGRRVGWFGGTQALHKMDADSLEILATYVLNKGKYYTEEQIQRLFDEADKLSGDALFDVLVPPLEWGIEKGVQASYRFLDRNNHLYMLETDGYNGDQYIRVYGDKVEGDPASDIVLLREYRFPREKGEKFVVLAMGLTYDGAVIVVTRDGTLMALSRELALLSKVRLPDRETDSKEFMNSFVRNSIAIDDTGGIYVISRTRMHRVQWTGKQLSLEKDDGAWSESYPQGARGSGTTPILLGWYEDEDHLVLVGDGEQSLMAFWRGEIPADWQGLAGHGRRVAAVKPMNFNEGSERHIKLENAMVGMGYGVFVTNDTPDVDVPWQGSFLATAIAERYVAQTGGTEARGGIKWEWNPETRILETDWTTDLALVSSICTPNVNGLVYCVGMRDGNSTIEALDWESGESVFHYILGKSYRYTVMGGILDVAPNGEIECGCAGGYGIFRVREPRDQ
jgi:hypothetical protein